MTVLRSHTDGATRSEALWSTCGNYRYRLTRRWDDGPELLYIMLNPSKATEAQNDPTIERCQRRATALGYAAFTACNLFALCATDPKDLKAHPAPIGAETDAELLRAAHQADEILCAWGVHGTHLNRHMAAASLLAEFPLTALGQTKEGHPRHPLYISYADKPAPWHPPSPL